MNIERLTAIAMWLEAGAPERGGVAGFNMANFASYEPCGTVCCIAGTAEAWWGCGNAADASSSRTGKVLGISEEVAKALFIPKEYTNAINATPEWSARCIRKLIATGEVDWAGTRDEPPAKPAQPERNQVVSWESCLWQPNRVTAS